MAPLTRLRGTPDHIPTPIMVEYYTQRASAGLIISDAEGIDGNALGDDEAGAGALGVVLDHDRGGDVVGGATQSRERRHEDAIGKVKVTDLDWIEKIWQ